jgi:hypothetical protein
MGGIGLLMKLIMSNWQIALVIAGITVVALGGMYIKGYTDGGGSLRDLYQQRVIEKQAEQIETELDLSDELLKRNREADNAEGDDMRIIIDGIKRLHQ